MRFTEAKMWAVSADYEGGKGFMGIYNFTHSPPHPCALRVALFSTRKRAQEAIAKFGDWPTGRSVVRVNVTIETVARNRKEEAA